MRNIARGNKYTILRNSGRTAPAQWTQYFLPPFDLTFIVQYGAGGWRIDDDYCSGQPSTSLYRKPEPVNCDVG